MKIVIDLDEKYYNDIKNSPTASNYSTLYALFGIRNGTPLLEELEKIKAEIHDMLKSDEVKNDYWCNLINNKAHLFLSIIDNHISELKGGEPDVS